MEHRVRLENGSEVFSKQDARITEVEHKTTPKPPSILRVVSITFGAFVILSGALWALSSMLADRPTTSQLRDVMIQHDKNGHETTRRDISELRGEIGEQKGLIKDVRTEQGLIKQSQQTNTEKLDLLLRRRGR
ncbi:MAG: hypothetical protein ACYSWU_00130 [Planctomycetota bacterium]